MPINFTVRADVVDVRTDTPKPDDVFLIDTNVWQLLAYSRARPSARQQTDYPAYIAKAKTNGSLFARCGLTFAELAHVIEKTEREIHARANGLNPSATKEFRHNYPLERGRVVAEIEAVWNQVKSLACPIDVMIDDPTTDAALAKCLTQGVDGYDLFILEAAARSKVKQVITDDGDYSTVPDKQVFTSNPHVLTAAQAQGKLVIR